MNKERNALKAGIFIVVSIALILGVIFSIRGIEELTRTTRRLTVMFDLSDDISGLRIGDEVRIGGYTVGRIEDIDLVAQEPGAHLAVRIRVPAQYGIRRDARARIQSTFTGVSVLNFDSLGTGDPIAEGDVLVGQAGLMTELSSYVSGTGPHFRSIMEDIAETTAEVRETTVPWANYTIAAVGELADAARKQIDPEDDTTIGHAARGMMREIDDVIGDSKGDLRATAANIARSTETLRDRLPGMLDQADQLLSRLVTTVDRANAALVDVQATAAHAEQLTAATRSVIVGNRSKLDAMIDSLKTTGDNLKGASAEIRRSPWRLRYKPRAGEMANLNLFDTARAFAEGADDLATASAALRDAMQDPAMPPDRLKELFQRVEHSFERFDAVEQKLWDTVRE